MDATTPTPGEWDIGPQDQCDFAAGSEVAVVYDTNIGIQEGAVL
jgi:hypothetical protein